jgi:hypothetical protein
MSDAAMYSLRWSLGLVLLAFVVAPLARGKDPPKKADPSELPPPLKLTAQEDHERMPDLLKIKSLQPTYQLALSVPCISTCRQS